MSRRPPVICHCTSVCLSVCRSASATFNIAVNRSLPLTTSHSLAARTTAILSSYKPLILVTLVAGCCVIATLCISSCVLLRRRRRRRRSAAARDPEVTSHDKMASLCSNGKVSMIHTSDEHRDNGHVRIFMSQWLITIYLYISAGDSRGGEVFIWCVRVCVCVCVFVAVLVCSV